MAGEKITRTRAFELVQNCFTFLPDKFRAEMLAELRAFAPRLLEQERAGVPSRSGPRPAKFAASRPAKRPAGGLRSLISVEVNDAALTLSSGLLTPQARGDGFYGYILDAGRGLHKSRSKPKVRQIAGPMVMGRFGMTDRYTKPYSRTISPIDPGRYDITFGRVRSWAREQIGPVLLRVYERALVAVAWGDR